MLLHYWPDVWVTQNKNVSGKTAYSSLKLCKFMQNSLNRIRPAWWRRRYITKTMLVMKLTVILLTAGFLNVCASGLSQNVTFSGEKVPLESVFSSIEKQTGFLFLYKEPVILSSKPVTVHAENLPLEQFLALVFKSQPLQYRVKGMSISVSPKVVPSEPKSGGTFEFLKDTLIEVQVAVRTKEGQAPEGASIVIKGSQKGVSTGPFGSAILKAVEPDATLVISSLGYITQEVKVNHQPLIMVQLQISRSDLDQVQIIAYGRTSRRLNTGNITTVKAEEIAKQPVDNPIYALQGRVPGLTIIPVTGVPGAAVKVQLRGQNSLIGNATNGLIPTEPLYVIDGVPFSNNIPMLGGAQQARSFNMSALSFINQSDIESIDVLKDADATAIYGSRGANGVILITTKKGRTGTTRVDVNVSRGFGEVSKKLNLLDTRQYLEMRKEAFANDGIDFNTPPYTSVSTRNSIAPDLFVWDSTRYTDWQDELLGGSALYQKAEASISGGSPTMQYRMAGTYNRQGYVYPGDAKYENATGSFSIAGISRNQKLRTILTGGYTANTTTSPNDFTLNAVWLPPNAPSIYKSNGELNWEPNPVTGLGTWDNPYSTLLRATNAKSNMLNANVDVSYQLFPGLTLKTTAGFSDTRGNGYQPQPILSADPKRWPTFVRNSSHKTNRSRSSSVEPQLLYNVNISKGRLNAIVGGSIQNQRVESSNINARGFNDDSQLHNWAAATSLSGNNTSSNYKYAAVFGRLSYNWEDKYLVNINMRRDGSSRFGPGKKWGNFGSVSGAWIFTQEPFMKSAVPFLSFGKLRISYGMSGNDIIPDYGYMELFSNAFLGGITYQGAVTQSTSGVTNPNYSWETVYKGETGIDLGFFQDRILLSAVYFQNRSTDLLGTYTLPVTAGFGEFIANQTAKIQNSGGEFTLSTTNIRTKNFSWTTSVNLSILRNKLLAVPTAGGYGAFIDSAHVGQPFYGVEYLADFRGVDPATGVYQFTDIDGKTTADNVAIDRYASKVITTPKYFGGVSNTFTYKGFSLDVFLQFTKQMGANYLYDGVFGVYGGPGVFFSSSAGLSGTGNEPIAVLARWQNPGDNTNIQRFSTNRGGVTRDGWDLASNSNRAWVDASFIRIKNVSLSYSIPESWKQKLKLQNVRLYIQGQNLLTITNYKGFDPETQTLAGLPPLRVVIAGVQLGL